MTGRACCWFSRRAPFCSSALLATQAEQLGVRATTCYLEDRLPAGRYRVLGPLVPLAVDRGATDIYEGQAAIFLKKSPAVQPPHYVAAEFICAQLANQIRLPVPPSFVAELPGEEDRPAFTALAFNLAGGSTPPIIPAEAVAAEPDLCTGVIVFDAWIINIDRHTKNISFQALRVPHKLNVFDHSHTLFFYPDNFTHFAHKLGITGGARQPPLLAGRLADCGACWQVG